MDIQGRSDFSWRVVRGRRCCSFGKREKEKEEGSYEEVAEDYVDAQES